MAVRPIITIGDARLKQRSRPIDKITAETRTLISDMIDTLHDSHGVGLAAVQVGELQRLVLVEVPEDEEVPGSGQLYVVLNPEIVKTGSEREVGLEGCLSIPGWVGDVERFTDILVRGMNRHGKMIRIHATGYVARVFQHEIDHCNGVMYIDRLVAPDRFWQVKEGEEEEAERQAATGQPAE